MKLSKEDLDRLKKVPVSTSISQCSIKMKCILSDPAYKAATTPEGKVDEQTIADMKNEVAPVSEETPKGASLE